ERQGPGAGDVPARGPSAVVARAPPPGARGGTRVEGERGGVRRLLRHPAAWRSAGRVGVAPEPGRVLARGTGTEPGRGAHPVRGQRGDATAALGRVPAHAAGDRVLAGSPRPHARSAALHAGGRALAARAPRAVSTRPFLPRTAAPHRPSAPDNRSSGAPWRAAARCGGMGT